MKQCSSPLLRGTSRGRSEKYNGDRKAVGEEVHIEQNPGKIEL